MDVNPDQSSQMLVTVWIGVLAVAVATALTALAYQRAGNVVRYLGKEFPGSAYGSSPQARFWLWVLWPVLSPLMAVMLAVAFVRWAGRATDAAAKTLFPE